MIRKPQLKKLLIIDDDPTLQLLFEKMLENEDLEIRYCTSGVEAFPILQKEAMDCVISDIKMPIMDGFQFLRNLKSRDIFIEVILMTSNPTEENKCLAVEFGACDFLIKPISKKNLKESLSLAEQARKQKIKIMEKGIYSS